MLEKYKKMQQKPSAEPAASQPAPTMASELRGALVAINMSSQQQTKPSTECSEVKIAMLFLIIDDFPNECIWRAWIEALDRIDRDRVKIRIHAKFPDKVISPWVRRYLVPYT